MSDQCQELLCCTLQHLYWTVMGNIGPMTRRTRYFVLFRVASCDIMSCFWFLDVFGTCCIHISVEPYQSFLLTRLIVNCKYSHILKYCCFMYNTLNNPSAHPSYSHYYLLSPSTLFFLHILLFCTFYFIAHFTLISLFFTIYMLLCCVTLYNSYFLFFCTVHWADLIRLHFTSNYTLYNLLCDK